MMGFLMSAVGKMALGSAIKVGSNIVNHMLATKAETARHNNAQDAEILKARIELAKISDKDIWGKVTKSLIFFMIIATFCYLCVHYAFHPDIKYTVLLPVEDCMWIPSGWKKTELTGAFMAYQMVEGMFMVLGFFCVPSRKR